MKMRSRILPELGVLSLAISAVSAAQAPHPAGLSLDRVRWTQDSPGLAIAVIDGDASQAGRPYSLLLKLASGFWIPPHWHPEDKRVFVVSGTLLMGMGDRLDSLSAEAEGPGTFSLVPARARHYEGARGETILLLYGIGPLTTNFVAVQPDFSGEWILDHRRSDFAGRPAPTRRVDRIAHHDAALTVERVATLPDGSNRIDHYDLPIDGRGHVNRAGTIDIRSRLEWEGADLVVTSSQPGPSGDIVAVDRWRLVDRATLEVRRTFEAGGVAVVQRLVFSRAP